MKIIEQEEDIMFRYSTKRLGLFAATQRLFTVQHRYSEELSFDAVQAVTAPLELAKRSFSVQDIPAKPDLRVLRPPEEDESHFKVKNPSVPITDHRPFYVDLAVLEENGKKYLIPQTSADRYLPSVRIVVLNMMMQGKQRREGYNNAFKLVETKEEYRIRVELLIKRIANLIETQGNIDMLLLQEAPIGEDVDFVKECFDIYLPKDFKADLSSTNWGLMMVVNKNKFPDLMSTAVVSQEGTMKDRLLTATLPEFHTTISTPHIPHGNNSEVALKVIKKHFAAEVLRNIEGNNIRHTQIYAGDWNGSQRITDIPRAVLDSVVSPENKDVKFECNTICFSSEGGHKDGSGKDITADHGMVIGVDFLAEASLTAAQKAIIADAMLKPAVQENMTALDKSKFKESKEDTPPSTHKP